MIKVRRQRFPPSTGTDQGNRSPAFTVVQSGLIPQNYN